MDPRLQDSFTVDDKRKVMSSLDENANISQDLTDEPMIERRRPGKVAANISLNSTLSDSYDSLESIAESDSSETDDDTSSTSDSEISEKLKTNRKRKKGNTSKRSQTKKKKLKKSKKKKSKTDKRMDISKKVSMAIVNMSASLSDLSKSFVKLQQNIDQMETFSGSHMKYTEDTLPTFPDGTSCIQFQTDDIALYAPIKTVDEVKIFNDILKNPTQFKQAVSFLRTDLEKFIFDSQNVFI